MSRSCAYVLLKKKGGALDMSFNTRLDNWTLHGISAMAWKYHDTYFTVDKNYSKYPTNVVTHSLLEPFVACDHCLVEFATDARRKNLKCEMIYAPVTDIIVYHRANNTYHCRVPCIDPREEERKRQTAAALKGLK